MSTEARASSAGATAVVKLNIGGRRFVTTEGTLLSQCENSFFAVLLNPSSQFHPSFDDEGAYFIDRDPSCFDCILAYLRTGTLTLPPGDPSSALDALSSEADFYGITPLLDLVASKRSGGPLFLGSLLPGGSRVVRVVAAGNILAVQHQNSSLSCLVHEGTWRAVVVQEEMVGSGVEDSLAGVLISETKNSIEQMKNTCMCAYTKGGAVQVWDRVHSGVRRWPMKDLKMSMDFVRLIVNTMFLAAISKDGACCKIVDLRNGMLTVEQIDLGGPEESGPPSQVTCVASDADPFLFLGRRDGTISELKQDFLYSGGGWIVDSPVFDAGAPVSALQCTAIADRQSAKLFLCVGTENGEVKLCSKTVHSETESFQLLVSVLGHQSEAIQQLMLTECVSGEAGGLYFSSLSTGGYVKSWHCPQQPSQPTGAAAAAGQDAQQEGVALMPNVSGPLSVLPAATPPELGSSTALGNDTLRCTCTLSHLTPALCEILKLVLPLPQQQGAITPSPVPSLLAGGKVSKKRQVQLLVSARPSGNALTVRDLSDPHAAVTFYPVDRASVTSCCAMVTSHCNLLITGHSNGALQVWDLSQALLDSFKSRPKELFIM